MKTETLLIIVPFGPELLAFTPEQVGEARERARAAGFGVQATPTPEPEAWLNVQQAADRLGASKAFLYDRTRTGEIPCHRIGRLLRFRPSEIDEWAAKSGHFNGHRSRRRENALKT